MYLPSLFDASKLRLPQRGGSCCSEPLRTSNGPPRHHLACLIHPEAPEGGKKYHLRPQGDEIRLSHQREERERVYNSSLIGCCRLEGRHRSCHLLWCEVMMTSAIKWVLQSRLLLLCLNSGSASSEGPWGPLRSSKPSPSETSAVVKWDGLVFEAFPGRFTRCFTLTSRESDDLRHAMSLFSLFLSSFSIVQRILGYVRPPRTGRRRSVWRSLRIGTAFTWHCDIIGL